MFGATNCGSVKGERDIERISDFLILREGKLSIPVISIDIREAVTKNIKGNYTAVCLSKWEQQPQSGESHAAD